MLLRKAMQTASADHSTAPVPDDVDVNSMAYGFAASKALFCALDIGLFDAISRLGAGATVTALAQETQVCPLMDPHAPPPPSS